MKCRRQPPSIAAIAAVIVFSCSCASRSAGPHPGTAQPAIEIACEEGLIRLAELIDARSREATTDPGVLAEATALSRMARELYLEREYELALELIDEAVQLLEGTHHQKPEQHKAESPWHPAPHSGRPVPGRRARRRAHGLDRRRIRFL